MTTLPSEVADPDGPLRPIDLGHLRSQTFDDRALQAELLDLFAVQAKTILEDLAASTGATGAARQRRADLLHTLCGSARAIGAWDVAQGAERLERDERGQAPEASADEARRMAALDLSVARACGAIDGLRETDADGPAAPPEASRR